MLSIILFLMFYRLGETISSSLLSCHPLLQNHHKNDYKIDNDNTNSALYKSKLTWQYFLSLVCFHIWLRKNVGFSSSKSSYKLITSFIQFLFFVEVLNDVLLGNRLTICSICGKNLISFSVIYSSLLSAILCQVDANLFMMPSKTSSTTPIQGYFVVWWRSDLRVWSPDSGNTDSNPTQRRSSDLKLKSLPSNCVWKLGVNEIVLAPA